MAQGNFSAHFGGDLHLKRHKKGFDILEITQTLKYLANNGPFVPLFIYANPGEVTDC